MEFYLAGMDELELLLQLRVDYFRLRDFGLTAEEENLMKVNFKKYIEKDLPTGKFLPFLAKVDGKVVSTIFITVSERPPSANNLAGMWGTVLSVMTDTKYQRQGICSKLLAFAKQEAKARGVCSLEVLSTAAGESLYRHQGFDDVDYIALSLIL